MDQGGDPLTKDDSKAAAWGTGGPGYTIPDEISANLTNVAGTVAMANTGQPNTGGSQFFINAVNNPSLNGGYTVFGKVTAGMDVVTAINNVPTDSSDRPLAVGDGQGEVQPAVLRPRPRCVGDELAGQLDGVAGRHHAEQGDLGVGAGGRHERRVVGPPGPQRDPAVAEPDVGVGGLGHPNAESGGGARRPWRRPWRRTP